MHSDGRGYRRGVITRLAGACAVAALVMSALVGCSTPTDPAEPTPSFTSEEQAFAAAEETYRAYVDALNQVDLSDPTTFEPVFALTTGEANAGARKEFSQMHADELTVAGSTAIDIAEPIEFFDVDGQKQVQLAVCLNVADVTLVDPQGISVVSPDRRDVQSMAVTLSEVADGELLISLIEGRAGDPECGA